MYIDKATPQQLRAWVQDLQGQYRQYQQQGLKLDLTRGKPSAQQLSMSNGLDGILAGNYACEDGTDTRNYGGLSGIPEMRRLGAELLGVRQDEVIAGGNSSLTFMHTAFMFASIFGPGGPGTEWHRDRPVKFICPVPGYDRHFTICEDLGAEMVNVDMTDTGPDMQQVEALVRSDPRIKGMWCVPKYSNPTGIVYSDATVDRIAALGKIAAADFRVFWDNAYAVHDLDDDAPQLASIMDRCRQHGTGDLVYQFASTSKISFAGSGIAFLAASVANIAQLEKHLFAQTIGPDKVNQLRHAKMFPDLAAVRQHMRRHAEILKPKFDAVTGLLRAELGDSDLGTWSEPKGGYFIAFIARAGVASDVIRLAAEAGVKLTPAGATYPYGRDPVNTLIRLAPSFPALDELRKSMDVFVTCVKLASVRQKLGQTAAG